MSICQLTDPRSKQLTLTPALHLSTRYLILHRILRALELQSSVLQTAAITLDPNDYLRIAIERV
jgi:hypothetical protein